MKIQILEFLLICYYLYKQYYHIKFYKKYIIYSNKYMKLKIKNQKILFIINNIKKIIYNSVRFSSFFNGSKSIIALLKKSNSLYYFLYLY